MTIARAKLRQFSIEVVTLRSLSLRRQDAQGSGGRDLDQEAAGFQAAFERAPDGVLNVALGEGGSGQG